MKATIWLALACLMGCSLESSECPPSALIREPFVHKLAHIAGSDAYDCGFVPLAVDASSALACAEERLRNKQSFLIGIELQGIDSRVWNGIVADMAGQVSYVTYDSDIEGRMCHNPRIVVNRCASISLPEQGGRAFQCAQDAQPGVPADGVASRRRR